VAFQVTSSSPSQESQYSFEDFNKKEKQEKSHVESTNTKNALFTFNLDMFQKENRRWKKNGEVCSF